jgi:hypothetical protein
MRCWNPGFMMDAGKGYGSWIRGELKVGPLGGARLFGRERFKVLAFRCTRCSHLELFAANSR